MNIGTPFPAALVVKDDYGPSRGHVKWQTNPQPAKFAGILRRIRSLFARVASGSTISTPTAETDRQLRKRLAFGAMYGGSPKTIVGHSHTPAITPGTYQVGSSVTGRLDYNQGPTHWLNATAAASIQMMDAANLGDFAELDLDFAELEDRILADMAANQIRRREAIQHTRLKVQARQADGS